MLKIVLLFLTVYHVKGHDSNRNMTLSTKTCKMNENEIELKESPSVGILSPSPMEGILQCASACLSTPNCRSITIDSNNKCILFSSKVRRRVPAEKYRFCEVNDGEIEIIKINLIKKIPQENLKDMKHIKNNLIKKKILRGNLKDKKKKNLNKKKMQGENFIRNGKLYKISFIIEGKVLNPITQRFKPKHISSKFWQFCFTTKKTKRTIASVLLTNHNLQLSSILYMLHLQRHGS